VSFLDTTGALVNFASVHVLPTVTKAPYHVDVHRELASSIRSSDASHKNRKRPRNGIAVCSKHRSQQRQSIKPFTPPIAFRPPPRAHLCQGSPSPLQAHPAAPSCLLRAVGGVLPLVVSLAPPISAFANRHQRQLSALCTRGKAAWMVSTSAPSTTPGSPVAEIPARRSSHLPAAHAPSHRRLVQSLWTSSLLRSTTSAFNGSTSIQNPNSPLQTTRRACNSSDGLQRIDH
jgi:hypothetical protein